MKFQFKEGQWFDVRKLTDWQKQWCLENLDWVSSCSKNQIKRDQYHLALYNTFGSTLKRFGTTSKTYVQPENEITFNDFYREDEEVSQESLFDKPRWVTCCNDSLGQVTIGKDYKVINVNNDNYTVIMDKGIEGSLHKDRFHKVTPQDLLPEEVEDSFDNLILTTEKNYFSEDTCFVLFKDTMSTWQKDCLKYKLKTFCPHLWEDYDESLDSADVYIFDSNGLVWGGSGSDRNYWGIEEIYFNDIFQEVN